MGQDREVAVTLDAGQWRRVVAALRECTASQPDTMRNALLREYAGEIEDAIDGV